MQRFMLVLMILLLSASIVWAACRPFSYTIDGKTVYCTECCTNGYCNITCY